MKITKCSIFDIQFFYRGSDTNPAFNFTSYRTQIQRTQIQLLILQIYRTQIQLTADTNPAFNFTKLSTQIQLLILQILQSYRTQIQLLIIQSYRRPHITIKET